MANRAYKQGCLLSTAYANWYPSDASFVWDPILDTDATQVDPQIGASFPKTSAGGNATPGANYWDMTGAVYAGTSAVSTLNTSLPFMMAVVLDRNNQASTFSYNGGQGGGSSINFGWGSNFAQPEFRILISAFSATPIASTTAVKGTFQVIWCYINQGDPTFQIEAGFNQTTVTQTGSLTIPTVNISTAWTFGAQSGSTTGVCQCRVGQIITLGNRSGGSALTKTQCLAVVQSMQNNYGI